MPVPRKPLLLAVAASAAVVVAAVAIRPTPSLAAGEARYVVVTGATFAGLPSRIAKPNAALLVADSGEVRRVEGLFQGNRPAPHACGYHYELQLWAAPDRLLGAVPYNAECEEFERSNGAIKELMGRYIRRLESRPTHYVYDVEVPATLAPADALKAIGSAGRPAFLIAGTAQRLPSVTVRYTRHATLSDTDDRSRWRAEEEENERAATAELEAIVSAVRAIATVERRTEVEMSSSGFSKDISHEMEVTLWFAPGTNLGQVTRLVESRHGVVHEQTSPTTWFVQVLDPSDDARTVRRGLEGISMVKGVYPYLDRR